MSKRSRRPKAVKKSTTTRDTPMSPNGWIQAAEQLRKAAAAARSAAAALTRKARGRGAQDSARSSGLSAIALASTALVAMERMTLGGMTRQQAEFERAMEKIRANEAWISVLMEQV